MPTVTPVPEGHHTVTPYLVVDDAAGAIAFYARAFGARELYRMPGPDGRIVHAEINLLVNGVGVARVARADVPADGRMGFRIGSGVNLHISSFDVTIRLAQVRP